MVISDTSSPMSREEAVLHHWSYGINIPGAKSVGRVTTFYDMAESMGLARYIAEKFQSAEVVDQDVSQHLLMHTISAFSKRKQGGEVLNSDFVGKILRNGSSPNFSYNGATPWERVLLAAATHFQQRDVRSGAIEMFELDVEWKNTANVWMDVIETFLEYGADPNLRCRRHQSLPGHARLTPLGVVQMLPAGCMVGRRTHVESLLREKGAIEDRISPEVTVIIDAREAPGTADRKQVESTSILKWVTSWFGI